jgi:hypothetical protein
MDAQEKAQLAVGALRASENFADIDEGDFITVDFDPVDKDPDVPANEDTYEVVSDFLKGGNGQPLLRRISFANCQVDVALYRLGKDSKFLSGAVQRGGELPVPVVVSFEEDHEAVITNVSRVVEKETSGEKDADAADSDDEDEAQYEFEELNATNKRFAFRYNPVLESLQIEQFHINKDIRRSGYGVVVAAILLAACSSMYPPRTPIFVPCPTALGKPFYRILGWNDTHSRSNGSLMFNPKGAKKSCGGGGGGDDKNEDDDDDDEEEEDDEGDGAGGGGAATSRSTG